RRPGGVRRRLPEPGRAVRPAGPGGGGGDQLRAPFGRPEAAVEEGGVQPVPAAGPPAGSRHGLRDADRPLPPGRVGRAGQGVPRVRAVRPPGRPRRGREPGGQTRARPARRGAGEAAARRLEGGPASTQGEAMISRRRFLARSAVGAAALSAASWSRVYGANARLRLASVGVGGKGWSDLTSVAAGAHVEVVALCDIDETDK